MQDNNVTTKFKAVKTKVDGYTFDSQMEARYYKLLKAKREAGIIEYFDLQPSFVLLERFVKNKQTFRPITYKADFFVVYIDGHIEVIDVKGVITETFRLKHKIFEYKFPQYHLTLVTDKLKQGEFIEHKEYLKIKKQRATYRKKRKIK